LDFKIMTEFLFAQKEICGNCLRTTLTKRCQIALALATAKEMEDGDHFHSAESVRNVLAAHDAPPG
jgi:hypothetical protein